MSGHTPGPWTFEKTAGNPHTVTAFEVFGADGTAVDRRGAVLVGLGYETRAGAAEANARLIAAAPELLEACQEMLRTFDTSAGRQISDLTRHELEPWLPMLSAAIAKATP